MIPEFPSPPFISTPSPPILFFRENPHVVFTYFSPQMGKASPGKFCEVAVFFPHKFIARLAAIPPFLLCLGPHHRVLPVGSVGTWNNNYPGHTDAPPDPNFLEFW